ncbi:Hypothetical predicted protein, partial [Olea europaea subsp. europaea]
VIEAKEKQLSVKLIAPTTVAAQIPAHQVLSLRSVELREVSAQLPPGIVDLDFDSECNLWCIVLLVFLLLPALGHEKKSISNNPGDDRAGSPFLFTRSGEFYMAWLVIVLWMQNLS